MNADDAALLSAHHDAAQLARAAHRLATDVRAVAEELGLILCVAMSPDFVIPPGLIPGGVSRRTDPPGAYKWERGRLETSLGRRGGEPVPGGAFPADLRASLPFAWASEMRISGLLWDCRNTFSSHIKDIPARANVRRGVMAKLAGFS